MIIYLILLLLFFKPFSVVVLDQNYKLVWLLSANTTCVKGNDMYALSNPWAVSWFKYFIYMIKKHFECFWFCFLRVVYHHQQQQPQSNKWQLFFHRHKMEQEDKQKRENAVALLTLRGKRVLPYLVEFLLAIAHQVLTKGNCLEMEEHTHTQ